MNVDVAIIGAGPSASLCAALLNKQGFSVTCFEKENFPRFVIGESLLPNCMSFLEEAELLEAVEMAGFQYKNGAAFSYKDDYCYIDFCDKTSLGFGTTFEVERAIFDELLVKEIQKKGVKVNFNTAVIDVYFDNDLVKLKLSNGSDVTARFLVDASGYGRYLAKKLDLEAPSHLSPKKAIFTHIVDNISEKLYDRNKILITTHPENRKVWFWLIPFPKKCSIGVVGEPDFININGLSDEEILKTHVYKAPMLNRLLKDAGWINPIRTISSYSANVKKFYGNNYVLLGNASEFLDPVFSSGITIALQSSKFASDCIGKYLRNEAVDFESEYEKPLKEGIDVFKVFVDGWYDGIFQDIIYSKKINHKIKRQISSILSGYAWDKTNPCVSRSDKILRVLSEYC